LSGGFPDFVAAPDVTVPVTGALARVSDFLLTERVVLDGFLFDDFASVDSGLVDFFAADCACARVVVASFFIADLAFAMA